MRHVRLKPTIAEQIKHWHFYEMPSFFNNDLWTLYTNLVTIKNFVKVKHPLLLASFILYLLFLKVHLKAEYICKFKNRHMCYNGGYVLRVLQGIIKSLIKALQALPIT